MSSYCDNRGDGGDMYDISSIRLITWSPVGATVQIDSEVKPQTGQFFIQTLYLHRMRLLNSSKTVRFLIKEAN